MSVTLSSAAQSLLKWLKIYKLTAAQYNTRIQGASDRYYNINFLAEINNEGLPRILPKPQRGLFKSALAELVGNGY